MKTILLIFCLIFTASLFAVPPIINGKFNIAVIGKNQPAIQSRIEQAIARTHFARVVERNRLKKLLQEIKLGQTGLIDSKTAIRAGKISGAGYLILLNGQKNNGFKIVDTQTGIIKAAWPSYTTNHIEQLLTLVEAEAALMELVNITPPPSEAQGRTIRFAEEISCINQKNKPTLPSDDEEELEEDLYGEYPENDKPKTTKCQFRLQERIGFRYRVTRTDGKKAVYLTVLGYTKDGMIVQLYPNKYTINNKVPINQLNSFPPQKAGFEIIASPPLGEDKVVIIASTKPVGLPGNSPRAGIYKYSQANNKNKAKGIAVRLRRLPKNGYDVKILKSITIK